MDCIWKDKNYERSRRSRKTLSVESVSDFTIADLFAELGKRLQEIRQIEDKKVALRLLAKELGIELRFCRLEWCAKGFAPKTPWQNYCCQQHCDEDWNKGDRRLKKKNPDAKRPQN